MFYHFENLEEYCAWLETRAASRRRGPFATKKAESLAKEEAYALEYAANLMRNSSLFREPKCTCAWADRGHLYGCELYKGKTDAVK